uniref:4-amino-4-deoxy-l-arabinose transferase and related glycosyltransferases of pmt family n=1 Tax=uncultured beta proteobacterium HF0130_04F21 TaxID=710819 RepID=E0XST9_9PROT|nr:4-amino-4-deoxy-l-arabinose transferase and related glycosyltransferases of pmt family [uncultured beta proteobacterium HF0130_04F21]
MKKEIKFTTIFFLALLLILSLKLFAIDSEIFLGNTALSIDEAQYIFWSRELSFGYFSKPPFIAWVLSGLSFFIDDPYSLRFRFLQPLAFGFSSILIFLLCRETTNNFFLAGWAGILFFLLPLSSFYSQFATTDAWLIFFWSLSLLFFVKALKEDQVKWWVACGMSVGFGLLTKYSMVFFLISALLYLISIKKINRPKPWLSFLISILIISPNIIWNFKNGFPTITHHAEMTNINNKLQLDLNLVIEFFLGQFIVFGPLLFLVFIFFSFRSFIPNINVREKKFGSLPMKTTSVLFLYFSWPIILCMIILSFFGETEINWAAPASVGICLYLTCILSCEAKPTSERNKKFLINIFLISTLIHLAFFLLFISGPKLFNLSQFDKDPDINPFLKVKGYSELVSNVKKIINSDTRIVLVSNDRGILANLSISFLLNDIRSWKRSANIRHHWDLLYPLDHEVSGKKMLFILKVKDLNDYKTKKILTDLDLQFANIVRLRNPELDKLVLQGRTNQNVVLIRAESK